MSVLARNRKLASTEFEMNCARLVKLTVRRADNIPNRYKKFIKPRLCGMVTAAYHDCIMANECERRTEAGKQERVKLMDHSIRKLLRMQKPLLVYWSLFDTKEGGIKEWVELINKEIALLNGAAGYTMEVRPVPMIQIFNLHSDAIFVMKMRNLHKFTYQKICKVPLEYKDHLSDEILRFADDALYYTMQGNSSIPTNKAQYEVRDKRFRRAIDNLNGMQRPLYALWNVMEYSENTMDEWAGIINETLKLLQAVRKSDRERFGKLK